MVAVPDGSIRRAAEQRLQRFLAVLEPRCGKVVAVQMDEVEGVVDDIVGSSVRERLLQGSEIAGALIVERHRLTVKQRGFYRQPGQSPGEAWKFRGPVQAV